MFNKARGCRSVLQKIFLWGWLIFLLIMILGGLVSFLFSFDEEPSNLANGFNISSYNIILDVKEDNKVHVTENIKVDFNRNNLHGIYKFTPEWLEYTGKDNKTIKRKSVVSNLVAVDEPYVVDTIKKKQRIKIGDADERLPLGEKLYTINYIYDMGKDPFKDFDEFIFHAYGDYWGTEIKNPTLQINMPKSIEGYNINFFADKYRTEDVTKFVDYKIVGNTIYATFNAEEYRFSDKEEYCSDKIRVVDGECYFPHYLENSLRKSLSVHIELPEDYFVGGSWNYGFGSFAIAILIFVITALTIIRWYKYGKNYAKKPKTVEFYPPENYSSAEIGYIYSKQSSKKLTISLIISLASKGYIKINDLKDKNRNIQITNLIPKPNKPKSIDDLVGKRQMNVRKLRESDSSLSKDEKTMMTYLFKKDNVKKLTANFDNFLKVKDKLVENGYIEILSDNEESRMKGFENQKIEYDENLKYYENDLERYNKDVSKLEPLSSFETIVYSSLFKNDDTIILSEHKTFYKAFEDIDSGLKKKLKNVIIDSKSSSKMGWSIFVTIVVTVLCFLSYSIIKDLDPSWSLIYILSFLCIFVNLLFTIIMKRKTEYGEEISAKINGFRDFLIKVEKPKLEELVAENPNYFYNILPYTYVLNVSRKWIEKFENIKMPEIDMGTYNYDNISFIYNNVYYPAPTSSSGSSSSCGGGCSSCGGGCSSCGGGGAW